MSLSVDQRLHHFPYGVLHGNVGGLHDRMWSANTFKQMRPYIIYLTNMFKNQYVI